VRHCALFSRRWNTSQCRQTFKSRVAAAVNGIGRSVSGLSGIYYRTLGVVGDVCGYRFGERLST